MGAQLYFCNFMNNKKLLAIILLLSPLFLFSQARLVINGTSAVTIVEHGGTSTTPIYIELANSATNAITVSGSNGWIVSESEYNMVKWDISNTAGTYVMPFGYGTGEYLPLTLTIGTAGSSGGSILFSTYHTIADQGTGTTSTTGKPSDVKNMGSMYNSGGKPSTSDNSYNAVDRFWVMDSYSGSYKYTTKPAITNIKFSYISSAAGTASEVSSPNVFTESSLIAQRFNSTSGVGWGDWEGTGGTDAVSGNVGTVTSGAVTNTAFYRSWTLSSQNVPLPIDISSFTAQCDNGAALIQWTSQTEVNNASYTVKRTQDGVHFETVATINGAGNSSFATNYSITDNSPYAGESYYFLFQTDFDGNTNPANIPSTLFSGCGVDNATTVNGYNTTNYVEVQINSVSDDNFDISLTNMLGQTIVHENRAVALGDNEIRLNNNVSPGIYILNVRNDKVNYSKKLIIGAR